LSILKNALHRSTDNGLTNAVGYVKAIHSDPSNYEMVIEKFQQQIAEFQSRENGLKTLLNQYQFINDDDIKAVIVYYIY
jgi:hypothetical protein